MKIMLVSASITLAVVIGLTYWARQPYKLLYEHCMLDGNPDYICYSYVYGRRVK